LRQLQGKTVLRGRAGPSPGGWGHLTARFFGALGAKRLDESEKSQVRAWLRDGEDSLFFTQPNHDQRHGYQSARLVFEEAPNRLDLVRAALLHDIGKRHSGMGPLARSAASAWVKLGGKPRGRWAWYLDHGAAGATDLQEMGAEPIVVAFTRNHHGARPDEITQEDWDLLQQADKARRQTLDARR
jgi:hypothetical protein